MQQSSFQKVWKIALSKFRIRENMLWVRTWIESRMRIRKSRPIWSRPRENPINMRIDHNWIDHPKKISISLKSKILMRIRKSRPKNPINPTNPRISHPTKISNSLKSKIAPMASLIDCGTSEISKLKRTAVPESKRETLGKS